MGGFLDEDSPETKKFRLQSSMRMLKDEPVPEGYMRFRSVNDQLIFVRFNAKAF